MERHFAPQEAIDLIKDFQPFYSSPYLGASKIWTIGYGHTRTVRGGMSITIEQANELLRDDLRVAEGGVDRLVRVPLNDYQFGALVSFAFQATIMVFDKSPLLALLNRGWYDQVPAQLMRHAKSGGKTLPTLVRRREAEGRLWNQVALREERAA